MALVLVVEDAYVTAMDICDAVERAGHQVLGPANSVRSAFRLLNKSHPDLALLDIHLGSENVYPVAEALVDQHTPIIFVTGYDVEADLPESLQEQRVINKPVLPRQLVAAIDSALANAEPHPQ